ncbi:glycoside hydrolase family 88 protein [Bdellovibrionota bacterium FG-1]
MKKLFRGIVSAVAHTLVAFPLATAAFADGPGALELGQGLATHFMAKNPVEKMKWDWGPAIFLHGLSRFAETDAVKRDVWVTEIDTYQKAWAKKGIPLVDWSDECASALSALWLNEKMGISSGMPSAAAVAEYVRSAPRNKLGALDHLGHQSVTSKLFPDAMWVDSLMMYAVFAAQWGVLQGDAGLMEFGARQPLIFASVLRDPKTGLFHHAWNVKKNRLFPKHAGFWLRGNAWVLASLIEILEVLPTSHALYAPLRELFVSTAQAVASFQMPCGLWDTVIARPGYAYPETSGSAIVAYAFSKGARLGLLDSTFSARADQAFRGGSNYLSPEKDGFSMGGISWFTIPFLDWEYRLVPLIKNLPYGVGGFLLAASEQK